MTAVVVAIRNKRYDVEEAEEAKFESNQLLTAFPQEHERKADLVMRKYMIDGFVSTTYYRDDFLSDHRDITDVLAEVGKIGEYCTPKI